MSNDVIFINKIRYLRYGIQAPKNSRFKGIITTSAIVGLLNYVEREDKKNAKDETQSLLAYSSKIKENTTFTNQGYLDTPQQQLQFQKEVAAHFKKHGDLIWDTVISMKDWETAKSYGLNTVRDYTTAISKGLAKFFKNNGLDVNDMIFWIDHHNDTSHPHCHVGFLQKQQQIKSGYLSQKKLEQLKKYIANELFLKKEFQETYRKTHIEMLKEKDAQKKEITEVAKKVVNEKEGELGIKIKQLYSNLKEVGRLSYNSIHQKENRDELDEIVSLILESNEQIKEKYKSFQNKLLELEKIGNQKLNSEQNTLYNSETKKLHVQIANYILKEFKNYKKLYPDKEKTIVLDTIVSPFSKEEDVVVPVDYTETDIKIYFNKDTDIKSETTKEYEIVSTKKYNVVEAGVPKEVTGIELFETIQQTLYEKMMQKKLVNTVLIHNTQLFETKDSNKLQVQLQYTPLKFQIEKTTVLSKNKLYSEIILDKQYYLTYYKNHFQTMSVDVVKEELIKNTFYKNSLQAVKQKRKKELPLPTARKIGKKGRSLGMSWMNQVEHETQKAIDAYLQTNLSR